MKSLDNEQNAIHILLVGSYNGQESFGDKCLLSSVIAQFQETVDRELRVTTHLELGNKPDLTPWPDVLFEPGWWSLFEPWRGLWGRLRLPAIIQTLTALMTFPFYLAINKRVRQEAKRLWHEASTIDLLYFYGGTQLSQQWFWLNFPSWLLTAFACRCHGVPIYVGPQQFGPQNQLQRLCCRIFLKRFAQGIRVRNHNCLSLLGLPRETEVYDEVFSCTARYHVMADARPRGSYLLINCRGSNFLKDAERKELAGFTRLSLSLSKETGLPLRLFQMSDATFCDDTAVLKLFQEEAADVLVTTLPYGLSDRELVEHARCAFGVLSMSFHGCILSMIGGAPAVPVSDGVYYDYKYADFDKYSGNQGTPVIFLGSLDSGAKIEEAVGRIVKYFETYDPAIALRARVNAAQQMEEWYRLTSSSMSRINSEENKLSIQPRPAA
jgi:hypothetical protein